jgi:hypothetical protein
MSLLSSYSWPGWLPSVDGKSVTDTPVHLYRHGKIAKVPVISELPISFSNSHSSLNHRKAGHVTNEIARLAAPNSNFTDIVSTSIGTKITAALLARVNQVYPEAVPGANYSYNTNTPQGAGLVGLFPIELLLIHFFF